MRNYAAELETTLQTGRFIAERRRYLDDLLNRGWRTLSVLSIARRLKSFSAVVDISSGGITTEQINTVADAWMKAGRHTIRRSNGMHIKRTRFINDGKRWLEFLGLLRAAEAPLNPFAYMVDTYSEFLETEEGLAPETISYRRYVALAFLDWFEQQSRPFDTISIADVDSFLGLPRPRPWARRTIRVYVGCLRSFFRFANTQRWCKRVADAIDAPRIYRDEGLPLGPPWDQVKDLIINIGVATSTDIRDRAILLLIASYGFRNKEVRELTLDDFDWQREQIRLHRSKQRREQLYPLARSVGDAIVLYLQRARPDTNRREVFLISLAPVRPLSRGGLNYIVKCRLKQAGIKLRHYGPHALRHTCATRLLARNFSLKEIGDHLGHNSARSTTTYAKVDLASLRKVAEFDLGDIL